MGIRGAERMVVQPASEMEKRVSEGPWVRAAHVLLLIILHGQKHSHGP